MKTLKKVFTCLLTISMCMSMVSVAAYAQDSTVSGCYVCGKEAHTHGVECYQKELTCTDEMEGHVHQDGCYTTTDQLICTLEEHEHTGDCQTKWCGHEVTYNVTAGTDGYTFLSVYPDRAYEMSNHMVSSDGGASNSIPQTLVMIDASRNYTWSADGLYSPGSSNYEVMYCCDEDTGYKDSTYYKRMNLEDSTYYDETAAAHIRAIITNSYPYVTLEQMKANLAAEGFADADKLTRAEIIAGVQMAVWAYANKAEELAYSQTFDVSSNPQWGTVFHDYTNEMEVWWQTGKRIMSTDEAVGARINALASHLKAKTAVYAEANQIVISQIEVVGAVPVQEKEGIYKVIVHVVLNNSGSSSQDEIYINVSVDGTMVKTQKVELGTNVYDLAIEAKAGQVIDTVVSGSQVLPQGVYFYEPKGGREISQSLVGVASGVTSVYAKASITPDLPEENPVTADLKLQKTDASGQALSGAVFDLFTTVDETTYNIGSYGVDEKGQLNIEKLLPGRYQLVETAAPKGYQFLGKPVAFTVSDQGEISLDALVSGVSGTATSDGYELTVRNMPTPPPVIPNIENDTISVNVEKVWVGDDEESRPESITVVLLKDGVAEDTITLSTGNDWKHEWKQLDEDYIWTVEEVNVPEGYISEIMQYGYQFIISNTWNTEIPEEEPPLTDITDPDIPLAEVPDEDVPLTDVEEPDIPMSDVPKTGDSGNVVMWLILLAVSAAVLTGINLAERKARNR